MDYSFDKTFVFASLMYVDKFVQNSGLIEPEEVFQTLLVSSLICVKFWEDTGVDTELVSYVSGITSYHVNIKGSLRKTLTLWKGNFLGLLTTR